MPLPMKSGCWALMYRSAFDASMDVQRGLGITGSFSGSPIAEHFRLRGF